MRRRPAGCGSTRSRGGCRTRRSPTSSTPASTAAACGCCGGCGSSWAGCPRFAPRRRVVVARSPRFGDELEVATFCSGTGALVAERRSTVSAGGEPVVEAVALWVHLDPDGLHPRPLPEGFEAVYGAAAADRRVRARLRHPAAPPDGASRRPWRFRAADLDLAGHVNNAVYWQVVEEELVGASPAGADGELEHRAPADAGGGEVLVDGPMRWIAAGGDVVATVRLGAG